MTAILNN